MWGDATGGQDAASEDLGYDLFVRPPFGGRLRRFRKFVWRHSVEELERVLDAFNKEYDIRIGPWDFRFWIDVDQMLWEVDPKRSGSWVICLADYAPEFRTGTPEEPDPDFEGWPGGMVRATARPGESGGFWVEMLYAEPYAEATRAYLEALCQFLEFGEVEERV